MKYIIKLSPEITIKSKPVRKRFIQQLRQNIKVVAQRIHVKIKISGQWDRLEVEPLPDQAAEAIELLRQRLCMTPGILTVLEVKEYLLGSFDDVLEHTKRAYGELLDGKTFCVRVKRTGHHDFSSIDLERYVGGGLNQQTNAKGVQLKNPDVEVKLEIRDNRLFVIEHRLPGIGGYPLGSQDSTVTLMSGGFDSTVAAYLVMKRGIRSHYLFFNLGGHAHEVGVKQVSRFIWDRYGSSHRVRFISVPFEELVGEILTKVDNSHMGVVLKRMMYRAAEKVCNRLKIDTFVTGEAVAQVSSQTMINLKLIDDVTDKMVIRPLIVHDKLEIIDLARKIGTAGFAETMPEYCGVISNRPTVAAKRERVEEEEAKFDFTVLDRALEQAKVWDIDQVGEELAQESDILEVNQAEPDDIVIDIRHADEIDQKACPSQGAKVLEIPFYSLKARKLELDQNKRYLLYCDQGVMSRMQAAVLQEEGLKNVGVLLSGEH